MIIMTLLCFQNVFRLHKNEKPAFTNFSGLKSFYEKLRFREGLVWTVGLTVEIKLHFQTSLTLCGTRPKILVYESVALKYAQLTSLPRNMHT